MSWSGRRRGLDELNVSNLGAGDFGNVFVAPPLNSLSYVLVL